MLKKKILFFSLFAFIVTGIYGQTYSANTWAILYKKSVSLKEKRDKTKQIADVATPEFESLIIDILSEQTDMPNVIGSLNKKIYEEWVTYSVMVSGKLKLTKTSPLLKRLYTRVDSINLKSDIVYNIGMIENKEDMPYLIDELKIYNILQKDGKLAGKEQLVIGLIRGLDFYKSPDCFNVLLDSYLLSYSAKTRRYTEQALLDITKTPSLLCEKYIVQTREYVAVSGALKYSMNSTSQNSDKIAAAKSALIVSLSVMTTADAAIADAQRILRDEATEALGVLKANDAETLKYIEQKWDFDKNSKSFLITVEALQNIATEGANKLLVDKLAYLTQKAKEGGGTGFTLDEGNKVTIGIIRAIGEIGSKSSIDELLNAVYTLEYGKPVINEAQKALDKINAK